MGKSEIDILQNHQNLIQKQEADLLLKNPLLKKDLWDVVDDIALEPPKHRNFLTINFAGITQDWLKLVVKLYVLLRTSSKMAPDTITRDIYNLNKFSQFLETKSIFYPEQLSSIAFEEFDYYLRTQKLKDATIHRYYASLCKFFDICRLEGWLNVETFWFKGRRFTIYPDNNEIVYIPEEVWNQLDKNLHHLPDPLQRMVLILRTTGIRIGELCNLPFSCLKKRGEQWRLRLKTEKYKVDDELPVPPELAALIKEQQAYIRQNLGDDYNSLFCNTNAGGWKTRIKQADGTIVDMMVFEPQPKVMHILVFNRWLNRLAEKCNICSSNGKLWHFASHQFRRTVATIFTNAGIRDLIIQKYLRHRSPEMQRYYKHLLENVIGEELEELMQEKKYVDITGKVVAFYKPQNPITELMRRKMHQVTTQYGECHRPTLKTPCQTVNACWLCQEWRTSTEDLPDLKDDLRRVEEEWEIARSLGMVRQQQGLEDNRTSLVNCITALEQS